MKPCCTDHAKHVHDASERATLPSLTCQRTSSSTSRVLRAQDIQSLGIMDSCYLQARLSVGLWGRWLLRASGGPMTDEAGASSPIMR